MKDKTFCLNNHIEDIIRYIGDDPNREGLEGTPLRVIESWSELYSGYLQDPESVLSTDFDAENYDELIILKSIEFSSMCEHHMLPFMGQAHIGYLPNKRVVGISKLARLLEVFSRRLQIQERITTQITTALMEVLQPRGAGCVLEASHLCMKCRGVMKQNSVMVTSSMVGEFRSSDRIRSEFLELIK